MFSQRNSTLMPISITRENSQTDHRDSSGMLASSEYSQSQRYSNVVSEPGPNYPCDWSQRYGNVVSEPGPNYHWSQASVPDHLLSSPHQDLKTYVGKPLLFGGPTQYGQKMVKNSYANVNSSIQQFHETQHKKKTDFSGEETLSVFTNIVKQCTEDVRSSLSEMKTSMNKSADYKSEIETLIGSLNNIEEMFQKFQSKISDNIKKELEDLQSCNKRQETALKKDAEIAAKNEKIRHMEEEIDKLCSLNQSASDKENILRGQEDKLNRLLSKSVSSKDSIKDLYGKEVEHISKLKELLQQNSTILKQLGDIKSWQETTDNALSTVKSSLSSVSVNVINSLATGDQQAHGTNSVKPVRLPQKVPAPNRKSLTDVSPLPKYTRWFDANGKPSPAAMVTPLVCQKNEVRPKERKKPLEKLPKKAVPAFDASSDSDSGQELQDLVDKIVANQPSKIQNNNKHHASAGVVKPMQPNIKKTPSIKATPVIKSGGGGAVLSPYIQRSVRRSGKIRKFSPSPLISNQPKPDDTSTYHLRKRFMTLDEHWGQGNKSSKQCSWSLKYGK